MILKTENLEDSVSVEISKNAVESTLESSSEVVKSAVEKKEITSKPEKPILDKIGRSYGTGRRKESVSRVWFKFLEEDSKEENLFTVNGKEINAYFKRSTHSSKATDPISFLKKKFLVKGFAKGGGLSGQADAVRLGLTKAIIKSDPEMHSILKAQGFLTTDARKVERKKPGFRKARRRPQFRKR
ncbi:30S ribosomal protein S9 [Candidatus Nesciobacter abundans]|uniref:30S ribosomal protein S9 n=1 Tax=Candidatus Nesciobacter abundans TaxID=2601668 RepID=A0A5C0UJA4_9PROT|nr:30S ribosomal protein S9 [Candidatus Nesciobacter abundans]QEK38884.1 30S ribosomal protein S9 [Candidatus Nesciobacter abundans]